MKYNIWWIVVLSTLSIFLVGWLFSGEIRIGFILGIIEFICKIILIKFT